MIYHNNYFIPQLCYPSDTIQGFEMPEQIPTDTAQKIELYKKEGSLNQEISGLKSSWEDGLKRAAYALSKFMMYRQQDLDNHKAEKKDEFSEEKIKAKLEMGKLIEECRARNLSAFKELFKKNEGREYLDGESVDYKYAIPFFKNEQLCRLENGEKPYYVDDRIEFYAEMYVLGLDQAIVALKQLKKDKYKYAMLNLSQFDKLIAEIDKYRIKDFRDGMAHKEDRHRGMAEIKRGKPEKVQGEGMETQAINATGGVFIFGGRVNNRLLCTAPNGEQIYLEVRPKFLRFIKDTIQDLVLQLRYEKGFMKCMDISSLH